MPPGGRPSGSPPPHWPLPVWIFLPRRIRRKSVWRQLTLASTTSPSWSLTHPPEPLTTPPPGGQECPPSLFFDSVTQRRGDIPVPHRQRGAKEGGHSCPPPAARPPLPPKPKQAPHPSFSVPVTRPPSPATVFRTGSRTDPYPPLPVHGPRPFPNADPRKQIPSFRWRSSKKSSCVAEGWGRTKLGDHASGGKQSQVPSRS